MDQRTRFAFAVGCLGSALLIAAIVLRDGSAMLPLIVAGAVLEIAGVVVGLWPRSRNGRG
jgi:hypothetical protein